MSKDGCVGKQTEGTTQVGSTRLGVRASWPPFQEAMAQVRQKDGVQSVQKRAYFSLLVVFASRGRVDTSWWRLPKGESEEGRLMCFKATWPK